VNIDFGNKNERQDCTKRYSAGWVLVREGKVNGGDEGDGIWWRGFIHIYKIEL
jgi:hypothetical protein